MFMDKGRASGPLPHKSIIKDGKEVKEAEEVKEGTQRSTPAHGVAEKMCYDATHHFCIVM
jgi:hypothetical protein